MLKATDAFAHGEDVIYVIAGFAAYQLFLATLIFVSGAPLERRFKFAGYYLLSIVAFWPASSILEVPFAYMKYGWLFGWIYFISAPLILSITFRHFSTHPRSNGTQRAHRA